MPPDKKRNPKKKITRAKLDRASDRELAAHWFNRYDTLLEMGFPTTAEVHDRKLAGAQSNPYHEQEERLVIIDSVLSMEAIIEEHKEADQ